MGRQRSSPWQELQAVRVPRGPSRHCSFAERDETPGSPASISSPTYGWEKQNCSNGASRVEGPKGWTVGDWGVPLASAAATSALGMGAEPPSPVLGSGMHLWVHHGPHHAQLFPPCRASNQPLHHLHGLPEIHREHRWLQVRLQGRGMQWPKKQHVVGRGGQCHFLGAAGPTSPASSCGVRVGVWCFSPFPAAGWGPAALWELCVCVPCHQQTCFPPPRFSLSRRRGPSLALRPQCLSPESEHSSNHASHDYLPLVRTPSPSHLEGGGQAGTFPAGLQLSHPGDARQHQQQHPVEDTNPVCACSALLHP